VAELEIINMPSVFYNQRPPGISIDTIVIHSMYHPENHDPFSLATCKKRLDDFKVAAHYLIDRVGCIACLVSAKNRAWHAGQSRMPNNHRENVNDFSIGIELIGKETAGFADSQYASLKQLLKLLGKNFPLQYFVGHLHIAPDRKSDPWNFDWQRFQHDVRQLFPDETVFIPTDPAGFA